MNQEPQREPLLYVRSGEAACGIPVSWVTGVMAAPEVTPVPMQRAHIRGICMHQGRMLTVFSLGTLVGATEPEPVAVVCRRGDRGLLLTVAEMGDLIADGGPADAAQSLDTALPVAYVSRSEPPVLVLDPAALLE